MSAGWISSEDSLLGLSKAVFFLCLHTVSLFVPVSYSPLSVILLDQGPPTGPDFNLITSLSPNTVTFWSTGGLRLQHMNFRRIQLTPKQHPFTNQRGRLVADTSLTARSQPCQCLDLGLLASRTMRKWKELVVLWQQPQKTNTTMFTWKCRAGVFSYQVQRYKDLADF